MFDVLPHKLETDAWFRSIQTDIEVPSEGRILLAEDGIIVLEAPEFGVPQE